jgi:hypothetical protein
MVKGPSQERAIMNKASKVALVVVFALYWTGSTRAQSQVSSQFKASLFKCDENNSGLCPEVGGDQQIDGHYSGHDEPSLLFYSHTPGSGNNAVYRLTLPRDPVVPPEQDGSGGTFNFQLRPALWFGMVLCDTQSAPNFTRECVPDTDANIFDNPDPNAADYIGHHPGSAFLELQFYPPGGLNTCADPVKWCVGMAIFSNNVQNLTRRINNLDCRRTVGSGPVNFAFLTNDGIAQALADPLSSDFDNKFGIFPGRTFQMDSGDRLIMDLHDTVDGLQVVISDLTAKTRGSMTASVANGFAQVNFDPDPDAQHRRTCSSTPYAFHPMYATSSEHTRSTWTGHTYNVSFSDEIGHFELCNAVEFDFGNCIEAGADDPNGPDEDDTICFSATSLAESGLVPIGSCLGSDFDFDGAAYQRRWPGTGEAKSDARLKPTPIRFTSPQFRRQGDQADKRKDKKDKDEDDDLIDYDRVAFEANMPLIEFESNPDCDIFNGGQGCTNPPAGAAFYPIFSTIRSEGGCRWQFGGPHIPGTTNNFGGSSTTEFGDISGVAFPGAATLASPNGTSFVRFGNYRRILPKNPCRNDDGDDSR